MLSSLFEFSSGSNKFVFLPLFPPEPLSADWILLEAAGAERFPLTLQLNVTRRCGRGAKIKRDAKAPHENVCHIWGRRRKWRPLPKYLTYFCREERKTGAQQDLTESWRSGFLHCNKVSNYLFLLFLKFWLKHKRIQLLLFSFSSVFVHFFATFNSFLRTFSHFALHSNALGNIVTKVVYSGARLFWWQSRDPVLGVGRPLLVFITNK